MQHQERTLGYRSVTAFEQNLQKEVTSCVSPLCEIFQTSHTSILEDHPPVIPEDSLIVEGATDVFLPGNFFLPFKFFIFIFLLLLLLVNFVLY